jgi:hypothetical protein
MNYSGHHIKCLLINGFSVFSIEFVWSESLDIFDQSFDSAYQNS